MSNEILNKLEVELYIVCHYQRGCFYIFNTLNKDHKKAIDEMALNKSPLLFSFICSTCQIMHVTPDEQLYNSIKKRLENGTY